MDKMIDWIREKPLVAYGYSVGALLLSGGAILVMDPVVLRCDPGCHPALPVSINVAKGLFGISIIGCFTSGSVALIEDPRK